MQAKSRVLLGIVAALLAAPLVAAGCGGSGKTSSIGHSTGTGGTGGGVITGSGGHGGQPGGCTGYPGMDPSTLPGAGCCMAGPSHCVPTSSVPPGLDNDFTPCSGGLCVPDPIIQKGSMYVPAACTASIAGMMLQGVCLSQCITLIADNPDKNLLPQSTCGQGELCVPCTNPLTMMPTGACTIQDLVCGVDAGMEGGMEGGGSACPYTGPPIIDPSTFPACAPACAGAHCVPASLVPAADQSQLAACPGGFCAPDSFIASAGNGLPKTCTSIAGAEGRCLSTCLPAVQGEAQLLPQDVCASDERCAPCYNPTAADPTAPTGACSLACDKPAQPPTMLSCPYNGPPIIDPSVFPACAPACAGAHCVPAMLVPAADQSQLAPCPGGFCAPDSITSTAGKTIAATCDPFPGSGAPGRCLSTCLPAVQAEGKSGNIVQSTCSSGNLCVPCNDPFNGTPTGACSLGCDMPPATPFTFPKCCDDGMGTRTGTCVPAAQVPTSEQSELDVTGNGNSAPCPGGPPSYLCVPDEYLPPPYNTIPLQFCQATFLNLCGTCVSQCVNNSQLGLLGSDDCAANHKCVPCSLASSTPGCGDFCSNNAVCGNSCGCDMDCASPCGVCSGGSGTCGDDSGSCDTQ